MLFHVDAAQAVGKIPVDVQRTASTCFRLPRTNCMVRKAWARSTCGARIRACRSRRMIDGGGHERGMRSGTLNVPGIVGLGQGVRNLPEGNAGGNRAAAARCATG